MSAHNPPFTKGTTRRGFAKDTQCSEIGIVATTEGVKHRFTKLAIAANTVIATLDVPQGRLSRMLKRGYKIVTSNSDLRALLYMKDQYICLQYRDLEQYYVKSTQPINFTDNIKAQEKRVTTCTSAPASTPCSHGKLNFLIDISSHTPARPALPSLSILPYIRLYLTMQHVRFHFLTPNNTQGEGLTEIASIIVHGHSNSWRKMVLESGNVKEVRIWWKDKCVDIVVWPKSQWAVDWSLCEDGVHTMALKNALGLMGTAKGQWKGAVVVAGVEAEDM
jgi:hypothetical protein